MGFFDKVGITLIPERGDIRGPGVRYGKYPGRIIVRSTVS
jgi:hypothetical protein